MMLLEKDVLERLRREYPEGSRVVLLQMDDVQAPPVGTLGTVRGVDDSGSIMVSWDNGSSLNVVYGVDYCRRELPDEVPGSVLTAVLKDGEWVPVGPIPKIDPSLIPKHEMDALCCTILDGVREYFSAPENERKFQEWKKQREAEKRGAKGGRASEG